MNVVETSVQLAGHTYSVWCGPGLLAQIPQYLESCASGQKIFVVADAAVWERYAQPLIQRLSAASFQVVHSVVASGEGSKNWGETARLLSLCAQFRLNRDDLILALGGGVVGDLAGFVAGIYLRGIRFVQVPTTLLAMVDSSVGGKTGINLPEGKNLVGAFHQPIAVFADPDTLRTLPERERRAGMAEVIKYGVIADSELFAQLQAGGPPDWLALVPRCVGIKARIVAADEKETLGVRALLNFGHTLGHAIEQSAGYGEWLHGEAVALGMVAAARLSVREAGLSEAEEAALEQTIIRHGLPTRAPALARDLMKRAMGLDKKVKAGKNVWVLTPRLGSAVLSSSVAESSVDEAMDRVFLASANSSAL